MVLVRLPKLHRRAKYYTVMCICVLVFIYKTNHSPESQRHKYYDVEIKLNENETLLSEALHQNKQKERTPFIKKKYLHRTSTNNLNSDWSNHMTSSKRQKNNVTSTVVNGTDIAPQILRFFDLSSDEAKDNFVNLHKYTFKLNTDLCKGEETFLAIIIHSAPRYTERRNRMRASLGNVVEHRGKRVIYVFVIGDVKGESYQEALNNEFQLHRDIVQGNFFDLYKHLARKHVMAMHWFKHHCNARHVLKLDDDTFINPHRVVDFIMGVKPTGNEMWCKFAHYYEPARGKSKWHTSMEEYPFPVFPPFCFGFAYIATRESWLAMYEVSATNRKISMDDVYVTGILAVKAGIQRYEFSPILWRCPKNRSVIPIGMKMKAILFDPMNRCSNIPFEKWKNLKTNFVNRPRTDV